MLLHPLRRARCLAPVVATCGARRPGTSYMVNSAPDLAWAKGSVRGGPRRKTTSGDGIIVAPQPLPDDREQRKIANCGTRAQTVLLRELLNEVVLEGGQVDPNPQTSQSSSWGVARTAGTVKAHFQRLTGPHDLRSERK